MQQVGGTRTPAARRTQWLRVVAEKSLRPSTLRVYEMCGCIWSRGLACPSCSARLRLAWMTLSGDDSSQATQVRRRVAVKRILEQVSEAD